MAERRDRRPMTIDDCAEISHAVSALLDVADPFPGAYRLEVSSPGIDRPLVRAEDFERFAGFVARVETEAPIAGRRRFKGRLLGLVEDRVRLQATDGEQEIPHAAIKKAKLVLTDELLHAAQAERGS
jgi:ribosome maturation factor RimP